MTRRPAHNLLAFGKPLMVVLVATCRAAFRHPQTRGKTIFYRCQEAQVRRRLAV